MKQKDKQSISQLEKKLKAEQEARSFVEKQLMEEKKRKKLEEATAARAVAFAAASRYGHLSICSKIDFSCTQTHMGDLVPWAGFGIQQLCTDHYF